MKKLLYVMKDQLDIQKFKIKNKINTEIFIKKLNSLIEYINIVQLKFSLNNSSKILKIKISLIE